MIQAILTILRYNWALALMLIIILSFTHCVFFQFGILIQCNRDRAEMYRDECQKCWMFKSFREGRV